MLTVEFLEKNCENWDKDLPQVVEAWSSFWDCGSVSREFSGGSLPLKYESIRDLGHVSTTNSNI